MSVGESSNVTVNASQAISLTCDHRLHAFDSQSRLQGSWMAVSGAYGLRVSCEACGKFYGYAPCRTERTARRLLEAYHEQRGVASAARRG